MSTTNTKRADIEAKEKKKECELLLQLLQTQSEKYQRARVEMEKEYEQICIIVKLLERVETPRCFFNDNHHTT